MAAAGANYTTQGETGAAPPEAPPLSLVPAAPVLAIPPEQAVAAHAAPDAAEPAKESAIVPPAPSPAVAPAKPAAQDPAKPDTAKPNEALAALPKDAAPPKGNDAPPKDAIVPPANAPPTETKSKDAALAPHPEKKDAKPPLPAKQLFAAAKTPAPLAARSIGFYAKGCLAGAKALPVDGPGWQVMRLSRNRFYGHPDPHLARRAPRQGGEGKQGMARPSRGRHLTSPRRPDAHWPRQPSDRARCGHLADARARPAPQ